MFSKAQLGVRVMLTKTRNRKTHGKYFGTTVLIRVIRPMTSFWPLHRRNVSSWTCQMSDYDFRNSQQSLEFDSDSSEKWLQLFRLMAHISLYNGWVRMPAAPQQGVKNYHKFFRIIQSGSSIKRLQVYRWCKTGKPVLSCWLFWPDKFCSRLLWTVAVWKFSLLAITLCSCLPNAIFYSTQTAAWSASDL